MNYSSQENVGEQQYIADYLNTLPNLTPLQLNKKIAKFGYIGQDKAKKAVSLLALSLIHI